MAVRGNPKNVTLGPGYLLYAPLGSDEPVDLATPWDAAFIPLGYTDKGSTQSQEISYDDVEVAEELEAIDSVATGRKITVKFDSAENTAKNYKLAMNGGTITVSGTAPNLIHKFTPPPLGAETRCMLGWESEDHLERWFWRECKQVGSIETSRTKGSDKALIPMEFQAYKPSIIVGGDDAPFVRLSARPGEAA